jgi:chromosome segregation ATPase
MRVCVRAKEVTMSKGEALEAKIEAQLREWAAELESLKAKADKAVADARRGYYEQIDELREEMEAKLKAWGKTLEASKAKAESAETTAKSLVERLHETIQTQLRELRPLIGDLRDRAEQAEKEAKRLANEWRAKREPARAALGELKTGVEKAWGELKAALDGAVAKFREPS